MTGETELMEDDGISVDEMDREFEEEFSDEWSQSNSFWNDLDTCVAKGKVRVMSEIFALEDISNAYEKVANGNVRFKAVIHPPK